MVKSRKVRRGGMWPFTQVSENTKGTFPGKLPESYTAEPSRSSSPITPTPRLSPFGITTGTAPKLSDVPSSAGRRRRARKTRRKSHRRRK
jgi:hypothetical protein